MATSPLDQRDTEHIISQLNDATAPVLVRVLADNDDPELCANILILDPQLRDIALKRDVHIKWRVVIQADRLLLYAAAISNSRLRGAGVAEICRQMGNWCVAFADGHLNSYCGCVERFGNCLAVPDCSMSGCLMADRHSLAIIELDVSTCTPTKFCEDLAAYSINRRALLGIKVGLDSTAAAVLWTWDSAGGLHQGYALDFGQIELPDATRAAFRHDALPDIAGWTRCCPPRTGWFSKKHDAPVISVPVLDNVAPLQLDLARIMRAITAML
ncbi:MAG: hypothetical protein EBZ75_13035 [Oxalobacteraceae bacterium]|nr:hypothetical protein [Oxalobacteraceae bacterium]